MSASDFTLSALDPGEARTRLRQASELVNARIEEFSKASAEAADAEGVYRTELAAAVARYRGDGMAQEESVIAARAEVAIHDVDRAKAEGEVKAAAERITAALDLRRSLWRLIEWSMRVSTAAGGSGEQWPR